MALPLIIQGGMGVAVSDWHLARTVSQLGHLGVVSGTALDSILVKRLQLGDIGGNIRRAFESFPFPEIARRVWDRFFIEGGKAADQPFKMAPMFSLTPSQALLDLTVVANFTEVFLAKEKHNGVVGINFLEKIQMPTLPSIFGAMLAGVDYVLMGAGIPRAIPGILDELAQRLPVKLKIDVAGTKEEHVSRFDPVAFCGGLDFIPKLNRPKFLAIISSATLALTLAKKSSGEVNGFIVEGATAGGHNAPPRGQMQLNEQGEPIYGERDLPDLTKIAEIGLPFWLAGSYGLPGKLSEARALGATGVQVGTAFAFCNESGLDPKLKQTVLEKSRLGALTVRTDPVASPTGFPFKVLQVGDTIADDATYEKRSRICDLGYLRHAYQKDDGSIGYRCPSEPIDHYLKKGGAIEETVGRKCVCNGLMSSAGFAQRLKGAAPGEDAYEAPLLTAGDEAANVAQFLKPGETGYSAADVIAAILAPAPVA
jgi:nitronate monooxygenase